MYVSVVTYQEAALTVRVLSIGNLEMGKRDRSIHRKNRPRAQCKIHFDTM